MSVFSEPLEHEAIAGRLEGVESVMILACPFCASLSLAYIRDIPLYQPSRNPTWTNGGLQEALALKRVLESKGKRVGIFGLNALASTFCTPGRFRKRAIQRKCRDFDAVVVLSCVGGLVGVSQMLGGSTRVIHGMRSVGCGTFELRWRPPFKIVVERETARVTRFHGSEPDKGS